MDEMLINWDRYLADEFDVTALDVLDDHDLLLGLNKVQVMRDFRNQDTRQATTLMAVCP